LARSERGRSITASRSKFVCLTIFLYVRGPEVSADGHGWTDGAYCDGFRGEYGGRSVTGNYKRHKKVFPYPRPEGTFDRAAGAIPAGRIPVGIARKKRRAVKTIACYGEWIKNGKNTPTIPAATSKVSALEGAHFISRCFPGPSNMKYSDQSAPGPIPRGLQPGLSKEGEMPRLANLALSRTITATPAATSRRLPRRRPTGVCSRTRSSP